MKTEKVIFFICLAIAVGLIIGGFFCPPMGVIDGSVLTAVGELFGFAALYLLFFGGLLHSHDAKMTHGNSTIEITHHHGDNQ